jgi:hypothetical protein
VTVDEKFITEANFKRAVEQIPNPEFKNKVTGLGMLRESAKSDADIPRRFGQFY